MSDSVTDIYICILQTGLNLLSLKTEIERSGNDSLISIRPKTEVSFLSEWVNLFRFLSPFSRLSSGIWNSVFGFGQFDTLQVELERVRDENQQLRIMVEQITKKYSDLHGQLIMAMEESARQKVNFFLIASTSTKRKRKVEKFENKNHFFNKW